MEDTGTDAKQRSQEAATEPAAAEESSLKKEKQEEEKDNAPSLEEVDEEEEPSEEGDPSFEPAWYRTKVSQEELKAAGISLAGYSTPTTGEAEIRFQEGSHIAMMLKNLLPCAYGRRVKEA